MIFKPDPSIKTRAIAGAIAGLSGGLAHALVNEIDRRVFKYDADDLLMVAGPFVKDRSKARKVGLCMHLSFAMVFGAAYAVVLNPKDERDAVAKGIGSGLVENTALWPLVIPLDKYHPYIRDGRIDKFNHPISFLQANLRHIALGYGLGKAYPEVLKRL